MPNAFCQIFGRLRCCTQQSNCYLCGYGFTTCAGPANTADAIDAAAAIAADAPRASAADVSTACAAANVPAAATDAADAQPASAADVSTACAATDAPAATAAATAPAAVQQMLPPHMPQMPNRQTQQMFQPSTAQQIPPPQILHEQGPFSGSMGPFCWLNGACQSWIQKNTKFDLKIHNPLKRKFAEDLDRTQLLGRPSPTYLVTIVASCY